MRLSSGVAPVGGTDKPQYSERVIRGGASDEEIRNEIAAVWQGRGDRYSEIRTAETARAKKVEMSYIGG